jgi:preprotein translocase subunit SecG
MLAATVLHGVLAFFFAIVALLLMIVILLQRGKGVGLSGAFGGTGTTTAFGAKTGDFLTWVTIVGAGILLLFTVLLNYVFVQGPPQMTPPPTPPGGVPPAGTPAAPAGGAGQLDDPAALPRYASLGIFGEPQT